MFDRSPRGGTKFEGLDRRAARGTRGVESRQGIAKRPTNVNAEIEHEKKNRSNSSVIDT